MVLHAICCQIGPARGPERWFCMRFAVKLVLRVALKDGFACDLLPDWSCAWSSAKEIKKNDKEF